MARGSFLGSFWFAPKVYRRTPLLIHYSRYIDEAGNVAPSSQGSFFVMTALCIDNPRVINRIVRKAHKRQASQDELKAKKTRDKLVAELLRDLAVRDIEIFAVIADHRMLRWAYTDPG